jgi:hypothetical protein
MDTPDPTAAELAAKAAAKADRPPTSAELRAYHDLLVLTQRLGREPTAEEAFALVQPFSRRLRGRTGVGPKREADKAGSTIAPRHAVDKAVRMLMARCGRYLGDSERAKGLKAQISDLALRTARDLLTPGGPYDGSAALATAKGRLVTELLRICGLSEEVRGAAKPEEKNAALGRSLSPEEQDLLDAARRLDYERQMRDRMGAGAAAAVNRLPADSRN